MSKPIEYAFPFIPTEHGGWQSGMTLRDYFASAALQGVMKDRENVKALWESSQERGIEVLEFTASRMYAIADAMLAARYK